MCGNQRKKLSAAPLSRFQVSPGHVSNECAIGRHQRPQIVEPIKLQRSHGLSNVRAVEIVNAFLAQLDEQYGISSHWEGSTLYFEATAVTGVLQLEPRRVSVEVTLGFMLIAFQSQIRTELERGLEDAFRARPTRVRPKKKKKRKKKPRRRVRIERKAR